MELLPIGPSYNGWFKWEIHLTKVERLRSVYSPQCDWHPDSGEVCFEVVTNGLYTHVDVNCWCPSWKRSRGSLSNYVYFAANIIGFCILDEIGNINFGILPGRHVIYKSSVIGQFGILKIYVIWCKSHGLLWDTPILLFIDSMAIFQQYKLYFIH